MKRFLVKGIGAIILVLALAFPPVTAVLAANPGTHGQPNQTCLSSTAPQEPGHASSSPGSPFNETSGHAGSVYAGSGVSASHAKSSHAVSQYDVACFQVSQPHH
jgi:hypothetical protein